MQPRSDERHPSPFESAASGIPPAALPRCVAESGSGALARAKPPEPPLPVEGFSPPLRRFLAQRVGTRRCSPTLREVLERPVVSWGDRIEYGKGGLIADVPPEALRPLLAAVASWPGLTRGEKLWLSDRLGALLRNAEALERWEATRRWPGEEPAPEGERERARDRVNAAGRAAERARRRPLLAVRCGSRLRTGPRPRARRGARRRAAARAAGPRSGQDPGEGESDPPRPGGLAPGLTAASRTAARTLPGAVA
jgi:hypothetical protein